MDERKAINRDEITELDPEAQAFIRELCSTDDQVEPDDDSGLISHEVWAKSGYLD